MLLIKAKSQPWFYLGPQTLMLRYFPHLSGVFDWFHLLELNKQFNSRQKIQMDAGVSVGLRKSAFVLLP